jgi:hypothetical protein
MAHYFEDIFGNQLLHDFVDDDANDTLPTPDEVCGCRRRFLRDGM